MNKIHISHSTEINTQEWVVGKSLLSAFVDVDERLFPEKMFLWEEAIGEFKGVDETERFWTTTAKMQAGSMSFDFPVGLRWKRARPSKYDAEIRHAHKNLKGALIDGRFNLYAHQNRKVNWAALFEKSCVALRPRFASMHIFAPAEMAAYGVDPVQDSFVAGLDSYGEMSPVADIAWATFFGEKYEKEVPVERIASAEFRIKKLGGGHLVEVTESIFDVVDDPEKFQLRAMELKSLFRDGFFKRTVLK